MSSCFLVEINLSLTSIIRYCSALWSNPEYTFICLLHHKSFSYFQAFSLTVLYEMIPSLISLKHLLYAESYTGDTSHDPQKHLATDHCFILWVFFLWIHPPPKIWSLYFYSLNHVTFGSHYIQSQLKPLCSFHISQDLITIDFSLLFDFRFSPVGSLSHNQN